MTSAPDPVPSAGWPRPQCIIFWCIASVIWLLTAAYSLYLDREVFSDETGLYNAIYTFVETGRLAYPLHGQPEFMTVHPPTHYLILGLLMKLGLPLFTAAAVPLLTLFAILIVTAATGRFSFSFALAAVVGCFSANVIWADYFTVRPDLHLTFAWFTGLMLLEAGKNHSWSRFRLAAGTALSVYAATIHYWGIAALGVPVVYLSALVYDARQKRVSPRAGLLAIGAGGLAVGLPFLIGFVVPLWDPIREMVRSVQGEGGVAAAVQRHLTAYDNLSRRLPYGWHTRTIVTVLTFPVLEWHIPATVLAGTILCFLRRWVFAGAAVVLPFFVLVASQGKPVGHTLYLTPEMSLYITGVYAACFAALSHLVSARSLSGRAVASTAGLSMVIATVAAVPNSANDSWRWTRSLHQMDASRAAGVDIVGRDALVGMVSMGPWYSSGGRFVWNAANDLTEVNRSGGNVAPFLDSADAFVIDIDWWHALPNLAPLGTWYVDKRLSLVGFVLPTTRSGRHQMNLFVSRTKPEKIRGYFLSGERSQVFEQRDGGATVFSVWQCPAPINDNSFPEAFYQFAFHYDQAPSATSRTLLLIGSEATQFSRLHHAIAGLNCQGKDIVFGDLTLIKTANIVSALRRSDQRIEVSTALSDTIGAVRRAEANNVSEPRSELTIAWEKATVYSDRQNRHALPLTITPPAMPWAYGAVLPLRGPYDDSRGLLFELKARVIEGKAGFGVLNERQDAFVARTFRNSSDGSVTINLVVPANTSFGPVVIQNGGISDPVSVELQGLRAVEIRPRSRSLRLSSAFEPVP